MPLLVETVVTLNDTLDHLSDLEQRLSGVPEEMRELHDAFTSGKIEIDRLEAVIEEARAERRAAEAALQDCGAKLEHFQEQVNRVRTQREYSAILQEIDLVKEHTRALDDEALAAMERQDEAETELGTLREGFAETEAQYQVEIEKWEAAKPGVASEAEDLRAKITALRHEVPASGLLLFERLRDVTNGNALAIVQEIRRLQRGPSMWHCSACNYNVRPQIIVEIKNNGSLVQCDSCKRLLFFVESSA